MVKLSAATECAGLFHVILVIRSSFGGAASKIIDMLSALMNSTTF